MKTLEQRLFEGSRAKEVLENEAFQAAFDAVENEVLEQWTNSKPNDAEGRERAWMFLHLLRKVKTELQSTLATGKLAEVELAHKRTMLERAKEAIGMDSWN